jgi:hypothetical protein
LFVRAKNESFPGNDFHKISEKLKTPKHIARQCVIYGNIGVEWITWIRYVFSDASARVDGQGHDRSDIVRRNTYGVRPLSRFCVISCAL